MIDTPEAPPAQATPDRDVLVSAPSGEIRYNTHECEGCRGAGIQHGDCEGTCGGDLCGDGSNPDGRCRCDCFACTSDERCTECGGYGFSDPDPDTVREVDEQARLEQEAADELDYASDGGDPALSWPDLPAVGELLVDEPRWSFAGVNSIGGVAHLRVWAVPDNGRLAVVTALDEGCSPTNAAEYVHAALVARFAAGVVHLEHYPPRNESGHDLDQVALNAAGRARWRRIWPTPPWNPHHGAFAQTCQTRSTEESL